MAIFSATVAAALAGHQVTRRRLVYLDLLGGAMRLCEGFTPFKDADGNVWVAGGQLGKIGDVSAPLGGTAEAVELTLSGVAPALIAAGKDAATQAKGRGAWIGVQHFADDLSLLDAVFITWTGVIDTIRIQGQGTSSRTITATLENDWTQRSRAPFSYVSDRDQKRLWPGDRGCELVASMWNKTVIWPYFT